MMKVKRNIKKGFTVLLIYTLITVCLMMASARIQKLENSNKTDFRNKNNSVLVNFSK